ncbi:hypothetical protein HYW54_04315 [Candidatus Gottesmanbacteria bacterium]|nr:hypothetical protein [Candidatus Gottesmanbacteria bacterium]
MNKIIFFFLVLLIPAPIFAQNSERPEFAIAYDVSYIIDGQEAKVVKRGLISNLTAVKYLPAIDLSFDTPHIKDIHAFDEYGLIDPIIDKTATQSSLRLNFNKPVLGIGKKYSFTIEYINPNVVTKKDESVIIAIPKLEPNPNIVSYNVNVSLPSQLGTPQFIDPPPRAKSYYWELDQLKSRGITLIFIKKNETITPSKSIENTIYSPKIPFIPIVVIITITIIFLLYLFWRSRK